MKATAYLLLLLSSLVEIHSQNLTLSLPSTAPTSVFISWRLTGGGEAVTAYTISYSNTNTDCFTDSADRTTDGTSYKLTHLQEGTEYLITVTASLTGGGIVENSINATTENAVPSAIPSSVAVTSVTSSTITVQWGTVPCLHQNGEITGCSVRYGAVDGGGKDTVSIAGGGTTESTISVSTTTTAYYVQVAAVNSAGIGIYSEPVFQEQALQMFLPGQPSVDVTNVESSSISLSWSVPSGSEVTSYEVVWEEAGGGGTLTASNVTRTTYTIDQLENSSLYRITVRATNANGTTDSLPISAATSAVEVDLNCDTGLAIIIAIAIALIFIVPIIVIGAIIITLLRTLKRCCPKYKVLTSVKNGTAGVESLTQNLSESIDLDPDVGSNEAYNVVTQTEYEALHPPPLPPCRDPDVGRNEAYNVVTQTEDPDVGRNEAHNVATQTEHEAPPLPPCRDPETTGNEAHNFARQRETDGASETQVLLQLAVTHRSK